SVCFFPSQKPKSELVRASLRLLTSSAYRLQSECRKALPAEPSPAPDIQLVTQQVIQCAYDIAKAAKQLVTITTKENNN
ncbi:GIT2 protein, partial [Chloropsis hardwickii]|nr:GIT2 protein [Chloropsis hardwickii]